MIGSKITTILTMFFVHDSLGLFWIWNQSTVDNGGVSRGKSVAVGVSDMWKVTCDTCKGTITAPSGRSKPNL